MSNTQKPARQAEANGNTTTVDFRGQKFTIPLDYDDFTVDFLESIEEGKTVGIVRGALGTRQWQRVRSMNLKIKELAPLAEDIAKAMGFADTGESPASSD